MVRKALHVAWKAGKEVFAMTSHVRPLFHLAPPPRSPNASVASAGTTVADVVDNFQKTG